eukprot:63016-Chlamydomonas_euryale.AAC.1
MTGLLTGGSRPPRQQSGFDGDSSHFDPICELAIRVDSLGRQASTRDAVLGSGWTAQADKQAQPGQQKSHMAS